MIFSILAVAAFAWGVFTGRVAGTMSNGPKQGTQFSGCVVAGIGGAAFGLVVGVAGFLPWLAGIFVGAFIGVASTLVGYAAANAIR